MSVRTCLLSTVSCLIAVSVLGSCAPLAAPAANVKGTSTAYNLRVLKIGYDTSATGISNAGTVVGWYSAYGTRLFEYQHGRMTELPWPGSGAVRNTQYATASISPNGKWFLVIWLSDGNQRAYVGRLNSLPSSYIRLRGWTHHLGFQNIATPPGSITNGGTVAGCAKSPHGGPKAAEWIRHGSAYHRQFLLEAAKPSCLTWSGPYHVSVGLDGGNHIAIWPGLHGHGVALPNPPTGTALAGASGRFVGHQTVKVYITAENELGLTPPIEWTAMVRAGAAGHSRVVKISVPKRLPLPKGISILDDGLFINPMGAALGDGFHHSSYRVLLWHAGTVRDLTALVRRRSDWFLQQEVAVNDRGVVLAQGHKHYSQPGTSEFGPIRSILLIPRSPGAAGDG